MAEFLPICDNLFNVISLAAYFCDCVFDIVLGYALLERGKINFFIAVVLIIAGSLIVSQIVSLKWYLRSRKLNAPVNNQETINEEDEEDEQCPKSKIMKYSVIGLHVGQLGVIWRYAKLFVPVDLRYVKHEVRDLCILRLIHAFCEAAPMLILQCYILMTLQTNEDNSINSIKIKTLGGQLSTHLVQQSTIVQQYRQKTFKDLNTISAFLSLFSVAWALASFSKNVSKHNVHRLVLTWLGVIFQFFWRLGTITSRVLSLTAYASVYKKWIFLVIILHWISMFLWLISPKNAFHGEQISRIKKILLSGLVAFIYIFAYINLQEANHRQKMMIFYIVMFLENCLLVSLWMVGIWPERTENWYSIPLYVLGTFFGGILIMIIYYKYFHIRRLGYENDDGTDKFDKCLSYSNVCRCSDSKSNYSSIFSCETNFHHKKDRENCEDNKGRHHHHAPTNEHLKGIFNCKFSNPVHNATKRKKKKPTSFIPPPNLNLQGNMNSISINENVKQTANPALQPQINMGGPMSIIPFWRQPLPRNSIAGGSSETEGSVASSRINIQLKLQEKKQKQLAELKIIEEEIKQGKLGRSSKMTHDSCENDEGGNILPRLPAPRSKKHIDIETIDFRRNSSCSETDNMNILLYQLQQKSESTAIIYNNFSSNNGSIAAALTKFSHEILTNIGESANNNSNNSLSNKQQSASSTMTSTTSENENNSLTRQIVSTRKKILHHNLTNNLNVQARASPSSRIGSPNCHYDHRQSAYNSLEGKNKTDTNRSSNSKNENSGSNSNSNVNTNSIEKEKSLASQLIKRQMARGNTPEILLTPSHLDGNSHYYQHIPTVPVRNGISDNSNNYISDFRNNTNNFTSNNGVGYERAIHMDDEGDSPNVASDIDSQMSLPRSYTLPREFKFNRQGRKIIKNEHFVASTNSSDGDVDSCDDNEDNDEDSRKMPVSQRMRNRRTNNLNKNRIHSPFTNMSPNIITQQQYQSAYNMRVNQVNNLDLINGCMDNPYDMESNQENPANSRQNRSRVYAHNPYNRHETKL